MDLRRVLASSIDTLALCLPASGGRQQAERGHNRLPMKARYRPDQFWKGAE